MLRKFIVWLRDLYLVNIKWKHYKFGKNFHAGRNVVLWAKETIEIGDNCYIGRNTQIETNVQFGNNVLIANNVSFVGKYDHHFQMVGVSMRLASQIRDNTYSWKGVNEITIVESDVWIGYGVIVMSGVRIKKGSIIAAGSVLTKDVEELCIYGGNPARKIGDRFSNNSDKLKHKNFLETNN